MTNTNDTHDLHDLQDLSGAYALHALEQHEAARFDRHLEECAACRGEVGALRAAAAAMGAAEELQPPPALRDRVLRTAARTSQLPAVRPAPGAAASKPEARLRRVSAWVAAAAVAAVLLVVAVLGLVVPAAQDDAEPALAAEVAQVFNAPDAHTTTVSTDNGGRIRVATSAARGEMAVDAADLPPLETGRVYQLWSVSGGTTASVGVLAEPEEGAAMALPDRGTRVIVTVEPAGGSQQPTTDAIVDVDPYSV